MSDELNNDDLEDVLNDDIEDDGDDDSQSDDSGPDSGSDDDPKDKRIKDLMSKWQAETARANAAEAKLTKAPAADGASGAGGGDTTDAQQWIELIREQARDQVFGTDPRFAAYGIDRSSIDGSTPAEMRDAARRLSELIDKMETSVQNKVLKKHGLKPEVGSAPPPRNKSFASMSDEEFEKEIRRAKEAF